MIFVDGGRLFAARVRVMAIAVMSLLQLAMCIRTACAQDSDPSAAHCPADLGGPRLAVFELHHIAGGVVGGARERATKPSVLKESVTPRAVFRGANLALPSSSPRELVTPRVCGGCMTWVAAAAPSNTKPLGRVIRWPGWLMWFFLSFPR
jgi:hypothetical protein